MLLLSCSFELPGSVHRGSQILLPDITIEESPRVLNYYRYFCHLLCLVLSSVPLNGVNLLWPLGLLWRPQCSQRHSFITLVARPGSLVFPNCVEKIADEA